MSVGDALKVVTSPIEMRNDETYRLVSIRRRHGGMFDRERLPGRKILTKDLSLAQVGAFVIAKRQVVHGATCIVSPEFADAALASSYAQLVGTDRCDVRFFAWLARLPAMTCAFYDASQGVVVEKLTLSLAKWLRTKVNLPALPQQRRIAEILDTVDEAIRKTEEIITKLKQVKQGLLHDLLTRGIDDNGELRDPDRHPEEFKDSPLGRIPKAWEVEALAAISDLDVGYAFKSEWFSDTDGIRLLRGENVGYGSPDWTPTKRLPEKYANRFSEYRLYAGDVVIGMDRTFTKTGVKVTLLGKGDVPALLVQRVGRFAPNAATSRQFVLHLLRWPVFHQALLGQQKGMDIPHLSKSEILTPLVPVPSKEEQSAIAKRLDGIDRRSEQEGRMLAKLRRVKGGLMEDLLTGRVRTTGEPER